MKYALPLLLLLAGGCGGIRTVGPDEFLYAFRCGAMPGEVVSHSTATYAGRDQTYHYVMLGNTGSRDFVLGDLSAPQKVRCRVDQLPSDFPAGFDPLRGGGTEGFENGEDTREYVQTYLRKHHSGGVAVRPSPSHSPRLQGHDDDPGSE
jgi:hypothetical protein